MDRSRSQAIKEIKGITADLWKVQQRINALADLETLPAKELRLLESLANQLRAVRGFNLGELRVAVGIGIE